MAPMDAKDEGPGRLQYSFNGDGDLHFRDKGHASRIISGILNGESTVFQEMIRDMVAKFTNDDTDAGDDDEVDLSHSACQHVKVLETIREWQKTGKYCDVTLNIDGQDIPCHRAVLASGSTYFKLLLLGGFAESHQDQVHLEAVSPESVSQIVDYVYSGRLTVSRDNAEELLHSSTMFQLPAVTAACCKFFEHNLDPENCFDIMSLAESYYCTELAKDVKGFVMNNFPAICWTGRFDSLTCEELVDILTCKTCHWSKETLLEAVLKWAKASKDERLRNLPELLSMLDLRLVHEEYLENVIREEHILAESADISEIVAEARASIDEEKLKTYPSSIIIQVGGLSGSEKVQNTPGVYGNATDKITEVDCLDPATMRWASLTHLPGHMKYFTHNVAAVGNDVYVLSTSEDETITETWRYMTQRNVWGRIPNPRHHHRGTVGMATLEGRVYVIGDRLKVGGDVTTNEAYSPTTNQWEDVPHVHVSVFKLTMVTLGGKLYLLGYSGDDGIVRVQTYSPGDESWRMYWVPDYHAMKRQFQSLSCGSLIYLMPISRAYKMYALDTHYRAWVQIHNPKQSHLQCGWTTLEGRIWLTGGREFHFYHNPHIECYDPADETWRIMGAQKAGIRRGHVCVAVQSCEWIGERLAQGPSSIANPPGEWAWMDELLAAQWSEYGIQSSLEYGVPLDIDSE